MATIRASFSKTGAFFSLPQPTSYRSQKDILYPLILSHVFNLHAMKKILCHYQVIYLIWFLLFILFIVIFTFLFIFTVFCEVSTRQISVFTDNFQYFLKLEVLYIFLKITKFWNSSSSETLNFTCISTEKYLKYLQKVWSFKCSLNTFLVHTILHTIYTFCFILLLIRVCLL